MPNIQNTIKIIECPRDAMQGWNEWIPTSKKIQYLQKLLEVGFHTLDMGSFVSEKAIPQLKDTAEVLNGLDTSASTTKLLAIVANTRGAIQAAAFGSITYLGYPFSISEQFQQRNTNKSIAEAYESVKEIQQICINAGKNLVIYISMGFGNPYGDEYNEKIVFHWVEKMQKLGVNIVSIADTVGLSTPIQISTILDELIRAYPSLEIGVHLHASYPEQQNKIIAALHAGCTRFDGALKGVGGCPMANNELVGNINTENLIQILQENGHTLHLNQEALYDSLQMAGEIFHV